MDMNSSNETNEINPENLHLVRKLGEGDQGSVHLATDSAGNEYAVKLERPSGTSLQKEKHIYDILKLHNVTVGVPHMYGFSNGEGQKPNKLVLELLGDSLETCIERDGFFEVPRALALARAAMRVLRDLHAAGIVHRDLALRNILLPRVPGHMEISKESQDSKATDQTDEGSARSVMNIPDISSSPDSNMTDTGDISEEVLDDNEVRDSDMSEVASSQDGDEKDFIVDFGFSEVYATSKNRKGKPRKAKRGPSFLSLAKEDVQRLLGSAERLVRDTYTDVSPLIPQIENAKMYLTSVAPNRHVDYDEILSCLE